MSNFWVRATASSFHVSCVMLTVGSRLLGKLQAVEDEVTTTRLTEGVLAADLRTLSVPFLAMAITLSASGEMLKSDA